MKTNKIMKAITGVSKNTKAVMAAKTIGTTIVAAIATLAYSGAAFASNGANFDGVVSPIVGLINSLVNPLLAIVGAGGVIFCIMLGVKYATAEEPQEKEKRKQALKTALIGYLLIFILIVALKLSMAPLTTWMNEATSGADTTIEVTTTQ